MASSTNCSTSADRGSEVQPRLTATVGSTPCARCSSSRGRPAARAAARRRGRAAPDDLPRARRVGLGAALDASPGTSSHDAPPNHRPSVSPAVARPTSSGWDGQASAENGSRSLDEAPWVSWRWSALPLGLPCLSSSRDAGLSCCRPDRRQPWEDGRTRPSSAVACSTCTPRAAGSPTSRGDLGISEQTVYDWRQQERIDRGLVPGLTSVEREELAAAKRRIGELEAELAVHRRASELLAEHRDPRAGSRRSR